MKMEFMKEVIEIKKQLRKQSIKERSIRNEKFSAKTG